MNQDWPQFVTKRRLFAATPDGTIYYYLLSDLASDKEKVCMIFDVTSAFLHAELVEIAVVRPPKELRKSKIPSTPSISTLIQALGVPQLKLDNWLA